MTRRGIDESGSHGARGLEPPAVCVFCKKPIVKPKQSSVTINEQAYHSDCWDRQEKRRPRS